MSVLTGIRPIDFLGNFYMTNTTEMVFGTMDADKSVCVELKHDDKLPVDQNTCVQVRNGSMWAKAWSRSHCLGSSTLHKYLGSTSSANTHTGIDGHISVHVTLSRL